MTKNIAALLVMIATVAPPAAGQPAETPAAMAVDLAEATKLLSRSDRYRGALKGGLEWEVAIRTIESGSTHDYAYQVRAKGANANVRCLQPARNSGDVILFNDKTLWFYKPGLRRPIPVSARQKLVGLAANGDIASTQYARDYRVTAARREVVSGRKAIRLELSSARENTTYDRVVYWIDEEKELGFAADFLSLQGQVFKRATFDYEATVEIAGKKLPFISKMTIRSAKFAQDVSTLSYREHKWRELPDSLFNINNILR